MTTRPVFLLTDFGPRGIYQGVMRAVILARQPAVAVHDLGNGVSPGAVEEGAYLLEAALPFLPPDAVVVVVVDPGVGSARRGLAVLGGGRLFVGPDNGVLEPALAEPDAEARLLEEPTLRLARVSPTFHGRDVFAPAGAALAAGFPFEDVGAVVADPVRARHAGALRAADGSFRARVVHVDSFGNLVTDLPVSALEAAFPGHGFRVRVGDETIEALVRTFSDVESGALLSYRGSSGRLELALRDGDLAAHVGCGRGATVRVEATA